jgi:Extensin-like protein C-terminus
MRIRPFFIITALLAFPLQASSASTAASPPLPPPRPADAPSHPAPYDAAPVEQAKPEPTIDQACLDRLSAAGIEFEQVTLPPAVNPECAIATPVRLKAVKLPPRWRTSIRLSEEPTLSCQFGERFGHWLRDLVAPLIAGELVANSSRFTRDRVTNAATATAQRPARSARTRPVWRWTSRASRSRMAKYCPSNRMGMNICVARSMPSASPHAGGSQRYSAQGSDAAHAEHLHVDMLQHGSSDRYRICQ